MTLQLPSPDNDIWQLTTTTDTPSATPTSTSFALLEEEDRPDPLGFPAGCPSASTPGATLVMPARAETVTGPGRRGRVLQPAPVREVPRADGALLALLGEGSTAAVLEVTEALRAIPGTGQGYPDARIRLQDGREGWVHLADMALSEPTVEWVGGAGSGLWLAHQPGAAWWGKLAAFERATARTWLVAPQAAAPIASAGWTGAETLHTTHLSDADQDGQREVLVVTTEYVPEAGESDWLVSLWVEPMLTQRGPWRVPVPHQSGLTVQKTGQARVSATALVRDTVDLSADGLEVERQTVYLDDPRRVPETSRQPLRAAVRQARRAQAAPSETAAGQGQLWEGEVVEVLAIYGGPLDAWRQPAWVQTAQGWLPATALLFAVEVDFVAVTLAGERTVLEDYPWVVIETGQ